MHEVDTGIDRPRFMAKVSAARRYGMSKREKKEEKQNANANDEQVKDSNELLALIRQQMAARRSGPEETRPKELKIPEPEG